ncbi:MAG: NADP(H)-dependent aldo-keto reductase [Gammaproteobacteria bacterium]|nr:NADP(H)-dependent aldo-keto reductase [Gammaproteobacteria bacterium]MCP5423929.1 NADP(H)-dependent aldo-keto reductase [Gammaproteobacteria bacterium]MCP5459408.1 NADP(H)-dependent aldo-keto reductase [Gammaproteobacteria bacterium]
MQYAHLPHTALKVSRICLGTMTWGEQNSEAEAHAQLDYAVEQGVNFMDTAEMYPVPPRAATQGRTEQYLGTWMRQRGNRAQLVLASKVAGRSQELSYLRRAPVCLDRRNIVQALEDSLRRLQTDYLDLYQVHWPDRQTNFFGRLGYQPNDDRFIPIAETLEVLGEQVRAGKIRYIGVSNETPWGVMEYLRVSERMGLPRIVTIQNPYNLLNRTFEIGLAEIAHREGVGLLAYSPLAFGMLTGKYLDGQLPPKGRLTLFERFSRYKTREAEQPTRDYVELARRHGLDPAQMALAYVNSRPFLAANIIGATSVEQLAIDIGSIDLQLPAAVLDEIEAIHVRQPNPCP